MEEGECGGGDTERKTIPWVIMEQHERRERESEKIGDTCDSLRKEGMEEFMCVREGGSRRERQEMKEA